MLNDKTKSFPEDERDHGPKRIGEVMPAVLARYGIEFDRERRQSESTRVVFVPITGDFALGGLEPLAAR
jgi:hypothetical protein